MARWWGQMADNFSATRRLSFCGQAGKDPEPGLQQHLLCRQRATKICAQLVDGTLTHVHFETEKQKHKRLDLPIASRAEVLCPGPR